MTLLRTYSVERDRKTLVALRTNHSGAHQEWKKGTSTNGESFDSAELEMHTCKYMKVRKMQPCGVLRLLTYKMNHELHYLLKIRHSRKRQSEKEKHAYPV